MNTPLFIARKYFFSTKKKSFINFISIISILAVAAGTIAFIVILSAFNGFSEYVKQYEGALEGEIKISPIKGKTFVLSDTVLKQINDLSEVKAVTTVLEDYAFAVHRMKNNQQKYKIIRLKGVSENVFEQYPLDTLVYYGKASLERNGHPASIIGVRVMEDLYLPIHEKDNHYEMLSRQIELIYPDRQSNKITQTPNQSYVMTSGSFIMDKYDNDYVFVPIEVTRELYGYEKELTSIEIKCKSAELVTLAQDKIKALIGEDYHIKNKEQQNEIILKAIELEKVIVFFILCVVLMAAFINIFFSLSMLEIEKRADLKILFTIGGDKKVLKRIFLYQGLLISGTGSIIGLILGLIIYFVQITYGFIQIGPGVAYPMSLSIWDLAFTFMIIFVLSYLSSWRPALKATKVISSFKS